MRKLSGIILLLSYFLIASAQDKKPEPFIFGNSINNISVMLAKGPHVEIIYRDRLGKKDEKRGLIRVFDKDNNLIIDVDESGKATYGKGKEANEAALTFWKALADSYPIVCAPARRENQGDANE